MALEFLQLVEFSDVLQGAAVLVILGICVALLMHFLAESEGTKAAKEEVLQQTSEALKQAENKRRQRAEQTQGKVGQDIDSSDWARGGNDGGLLRKRNTKPAEAEKPRPSVPKEDPKIAEEEAKKPAWKRQVQPGGFIQVQKKAKPVKKKGKDESKKESAAAGSSSSSEDDLFASGADDNVEDDVTGDASDTKRGSPQGGNVSPLAGGSAPASHQRTQFRSTFRGGRGGPAPALPKKGGRGVEKKEEKKAPPPKVPFKLSSGGRGWNPVARVEDVDGEQGSDADFPAVYEAPSGSSGSSSSGNEADYAADEGYDNTEE